MVVELVPLKGGIGSIWGPPEGKDYKWYISGKNTANWGMDYATYHLLGEPETSIDYRFPLLGTSETCAVLEFVGGDIRISIIYSSLSI